MTRKLSTSEASALLAQTAIFGQLDPAALAGLASESTVRSYPRGQTVFHQGHVVSGHLLGDIGQDFSDLLDVRSQLATIGY